MIYRLFSTNLSALGTSLRYTDNMKGDSIRSFSFLPGLPGLP
jgi:hypothetical protein